MFVRWLVKVHFLLFSTIWIMHVGVFMIYLIYPIPDPNNPPGLL